MIKVLQLTTYDIDEANHGGKIRCLNIRKKLKEVFEVKTLSIEVSDVESVDGFKIKLCRKKFESIGGNKYIIDWYINNYLTYCSYLLDQITAMCLEYNPDIIIFEQPYLWPTFENIIVQLESNKNIFVVNSTQNVECQLKQEIYSSRFDEQTAINYLDIVNSLERNVINRSQLSISVSNKDMDYVSKLNPSIPAYAFGNGSSRPEDDSNLESWNTKFRFNDLPNLVFVGSAHPPNVDGLKSLIKYTATYKKQPNWNVWVLGSVEQLLAKDEEFMRIQPSWIKVIGSLSGTDIDSAILASDGIILPIWSGGGSNLKTAQAVLSNKFILSSNYAFRGFEDYMMLNRACLVDKPEDMAFWLFNNNEIYNIIENPDEKESLERITWPGILSELNDIVMDNYNKYRNEE